MKQRSIELKVDYCGDTCVAVYFKGNKEPHMVIDGAQIEDLDEARIREHMNGCDWTDRGSPGWITPRYRCDDFLKREAKYPHIETKEDYAQYERAVEENLKGLKFVSTGACRGCDECGLDEDCSDLELEAACEPGFSWSPCDACNRSLGGDRHPAHGVLDSGEPEEMMVHLSVCTDCLHYINYDRLDDQTMMDLK